MEAMAFLTRLVTDIEVRSPIILSGHFQESGRRPSINQSRKTSFSTSSFSSPKTCNISADSALPISAWMKSSGPPRAWDSLETRAAARSFNTRKSFGEVCMSSSTSSGSTVVGAYLFGGSVSWRDKEASCSITPCLARRWRSTVRPSPQRKTPVMAKR